MVNFEFILLISGLGLAALSVYLFASAVFGTNADLAALAWASGDEPNKSKSGFINFSRPLVHNFTLQHAQRIKAPKYRERVTKKVLTAGLSRELNVDEFIGLQILWGVMFPGFLVILNFALRLDLPYWLCLSLGVPGIWFPHLHISMTKTMRYNSVIVDLPFITDLLALSTEAGLDFIQAIQRIVDKLESSVLAEELSTVMKDIKLGSSRKDALKALASRLDIPEVTSFVGVIIDADQTGASIASVLKEQSGQMRMERFVRAEKAGAKASQLMLLPMMFLIVPAVFVVVFAPFMVQLYYGGGS